MFLVKSVSRLFSQTLNAYKYLRSISETSLLYRPLQNRQLNTEESLKDRVVQTFFDASNIHITVTQAQERLKQVSQFSTPSHSYYQITLPFSQNPTLRKKMVQFSNNSIRVGRLLQLMDYIAANVAYRYCTPEMEKDKMLQEIPFIMVTAAIDSIEFYYPIPTEIDCTLSGYVSYVGRSSLEVHIDVMQFIDGQERLACSANFVMVARNKQTGKSYPVPSIFFQKEKATFRIINQLGQKRNSARKKQIKKTLEFSPPTYEESVKIHQLNQELKNHPKNFVPIASTVTKNTMLMHTEDKNLSNKIFGGFILRIGYQLGWLCASKFLKSSLPKVTNVDDVQFLAPVQIGTYVQLEAKIGYVTEQYVHVIVSCRNSEIAGKDVLTNILRFTLEHEVNPEQLSRVYPQTLEDSYLYIESMRRVNKLDSLYI